MAEHLSRIYGTEEDKLNCPFYIKMGACRHGDRCARQHLKPMFSQTLLIPHMFQMPAPGPNGRPNWSGEENKRFDNFADDVVDELRKFGRVENLCVCENLGDHLIGNVYIRFSSHEECENALNGLNNRFYAGQLVLPEYSPVTDFRESRCRQFDEKVCDRGGYCNFHHFKKLPRDVISRLVKAEEEGFASRGRGRQDREYREEDSRRNTNRERERDYERRDSRRDDDRHRSGRGRSRDRDDRRRDEPSAPASTAGGRSASEERRIKIAQWNKERAEKN